MLRSKYRFIALMAALPLVIELLLYCFLRSPWLYIGVPKALPKFRDIYILTLNSVCDIPASQFLLKGSCSDQFYGVETGHFDYPVLQFYIYQLLPEWIFQHANILAFLTGSTFLLLMTFAFLPQIKKITTLSVLLLTLYSFPIRYLLERGQLDTVAWSFPLAAAILLRKLISSNLQDPTKVHSAKKIGSLIFLAALAISACMKAFTWPSLLVSSLYILTQIRFKTSEKYLVAVIPIAVLIIIFYPGIIPGSNATAIQTMPGEIFGMRVFSDENPAQYIVKIASISAGIVCGALICTKISSYFRQNLNITLLMIVGSTSYLSFYLLTSSANYKLTSLAITLMSIAVLLDFTHQQGPKHLVQRHLREFSTLNCSVFVLSSLLVCYFNYKPYYPGLQFLAQDCFDLLLTPYIFGVCISLILAPFSQLRHHTTAYSH